MIWEGINPLTNKLRRQGHALESSFAHLDGSLLTKLVGRDSIPVSIVMPTDKVHLGLSMEHTHLQQVLGEIAGILYMTSKEEVLHHAFHGELLQVDVALSLCTLKLWTRSVGRRKLSTQCRPVGLRRAVSRYCSICSNVFNPVDRNHFKSAADTPRNDRIAFTQDFPLKMPAINSH